MTSREVRVILSEMASDADFEAFCVDHFPEAHREFDTDMDRVERINLLFRRVGPEALIEALCKAQLVPTSVLEAAKIPPVSSSEFFERKELPAILRARLALQEKTLGADHIEVAITLHAL